MKKRAIRIGSVVLMIVSAFPALSYYTRPLTYPENKFMDRLLVQLEARVDQQQTTRVALEAKVRPYRDQFNDTEFDEFLEILYDEIALRSRYGVWGYAKAILPTPVVSSPNFAQIRGGSGPDHYGLGITDEMIRSLVAVALPGTTFTVFFQRPDTGSTIYGVYSREIMPPNGKRARYIDSRFVEFVDTKPMERTITLLPVEKIYENLLTTEGKRYVRGGTYAYGIPEMSSRYPHSPVIPTPLKQLRTMEGVDCSGLLYQATNGRTPRNTALLVDFGEPLDIEGKSVDEIMQLIKPLDLIVWRGHIMIILNQNDVIESRYDYDTVTPGSQGGVRIRPLRDVLTETMKYRTPVSDYNNPVFAEDGKFVINRWYEEGAERKH